MIKSYLSQSQSGAHFVSRQRAVNLFMPPVTVTSTRSDRLTAFCIGDQMKIIELTKGQVTKVSDEWYEELNKYNWYAHFDPPSQTYYALRRSKSLFGKSKIIKMHRVVTNVPDNMIVDHIDHDTLNNQSDNLRVCTVAQNQYNRQVNKNNRTGYKGVKPHGRGYMARIVVDGKEIYLETWDTQEQAAVAYDAAAIKYFGKFANLNFPEDS